MHSEAVLSGTCFGKCVVVHSFLEGSRELNELKFAVGIFHRAKGNYFRI